MTKEEEIKVIRNINPEDYFLEEIEKNVNVLNGKTAVLFKSCLNEKTTVLFSIEEMNGFILHAFLYRDEFGKQVILNGYYDEEKIKAIKEVWDRFFRIHKNDQKMKSIRIKYLVNMS